MHKIIRSATIGQACQLSFDVLLALCGLLLVIVGIAKRFNNVLVNGSLVNIFNAVHLSDDPESLTNTMITVNELFISLGAVTIAASIIGWIGSACKWKWFLFSYIIVLLLMVLMGVVAVVTAYKLYLTDKEKLSVAMMQNLETRYIGSGTPNRISSAWDKLFFDYQCCGVINYTDTWKASDWNTRVTINGTVYIIQTPLYCCKNIPEFTDQDLPSPPEIDALWGCARQPMSTNSNFENGCVDTVHNLIKEYTKVFIGFGIFTIVIMAVCMVLSTYLFVMLKDYEDI